ncbi:Aldehyde/histidinol dehydrogenase [Suillus bovinus]|uniref:Aldehyde/histidinol dehydrogenase n=1 Tax=Suillus bovinus TaxID=48563 RepID=UPI001B8789F0|nr:Aldehyde/histidinol dehydrogenase [Suillus bovinus]KAG2156901.1 Aldehyde/histidinol dehydrogenase [Suillus bovinus]
MSSMAPELKFTTLEEIDEIYSTLNKTFRSGKTKPIAFRKVQILQLGYLLQDNLERFKEALAIDLGRPSLESSFLELDSTISDCKIAYDRVEKWARTEKAPFNIKFAAFRPVIRKEPKGVVLSISPFNYPVWLALGPVIGAIAAGNCVVLKPSELAAATSGLIAELIPKYMDNDVIRVVLGAVPETSKLMEYQWGHVLYTGNGRVGKIIGVAAAKTLSPISLELGGKSPVVIDPKCNFKIAARRILWGKCANAGQTCVAPDYVLVPRSSEDAFIKALKDAHDEFYPSGATNTQDISHIISSAHFHRLKNLLDNTSGTIIFGGQTDESRKFIAPTVVKGIQGEDSLMSDELFGPILPIMAVDDVDAAIAYINAHDHPLALYCFSSDTAFKNKVFDNTQSGSAVANDVLLHCGTDGLPFGGIGPSGSGYHARGFTFDMFTHLRASLDSPGWIDNILAGRFPPYSPEKLASLRNFGTKLPPRPRISANGHVRSRNIHFELGLLNRPSKELTKRRYNTKWLFLAVSLAIVSVGYTRVADVGEWARWLKGLIKL